MANEKLLEHIKLPKNIIFKICGTRDHLTLLDVTFVCIHTTSRFYFVAQIKTTHIKFKHIIYVFTQYKKNSLKINLKVSTKS